MQIRAVCAADTEPLLRLMREFYDSPALLCHAPTEVLRRDIAACLSDSPYIEGFVCERDGEIVGYTMVSKGYSTEYGGMSIMIEDLFVKSDCRGKGYGAALLRFIEERFSDAVRLRLEVEPNNAGAIRLYEKCGYSELLYTQLHKKP